MFVLRKNNQYLTVNGELAGLYAHKEWKVYSVYVAASQDAMKMNMNVDIVSVESIMHSLAEIILSGLHDEIPRGIIRCEEQE